MHFSLRSILFYKNIIVADIGSSVASWSRRSIDISRAERHLAGRAASVATASERASQASGSFASHASSHHTLGPGDPVHLTPQQLGAMGKLI